MNAKPPEDIDEGLKFVARTRLFFDVIKLALETDSSRLITLAIDTTVIHNITNHGNRPEVLDELRKHEEGQFEVLGEFLMEVSVFGDVAAATRAFGTGRPRGAADIDLGQGGYTSVDPVRGLLVTARDYNLTISMSWRPADSAAAAVAGLGGGRGRAASSADRSCVSRSRRLPASRSSASLRRRASISACFCSTSLVRRSARRRLSRSLCRASCSFASET